MCSGPGLRHAVRQQQQQQQQQQLQWRPHSQAWEEATAVASSCSGDHIRSSRKRRDVGRTHSQAWEQSRMPEVRLDEMQA